MSASEIAAMSVASADGVHPQWVEGPFTSDRLDVAVVTMSPGISTPPHTHLGGQVLIVTSGKGYVEANGVRRVVSAGDVVVCPPGESHVHGAFDDHHLAHLSVTTGGYTI